LNSKSDDFFAAAAASRSPHKYSIGFHSFFRMFLIWLNK
jgi:hypothetical protein